MKPTRILILEEDKGTRERLFNFLSRQAWEVKALPALPDISAPGSGRDEFDLALINLARDAEENINRLKRLKAFYPHTSIIALSRFENDELSLTLLQKEIVDQIASADNRGNIFSAVKNELEKRKLAAENAAYVHHLKRLRLAQAKNMRRADELEEVYNATLENLMTALDLRDVETFGHSMTVTKYCQALARLLGIKDEDRLNNIRKGALLHDVGKIAIPDSILKKPGRLTTTEWEKVKLHPVLGYGLVKEIKLVKEVGNVILYHHERFDGKGYPKGLKKEEIPLEARIFALADALDAITSHRPYRKERSFKAAKRDIEENKGKQFDPNVVDAFCSMKLEDWERIRYETTKIFPSLENFSEIYTKP